MIVAVNVQVTGTWLEDPDITNESQDLALAVSNGVLLKKRRATMKIKVRISDFQDKFNEMNLSRLVVQ